MNYFMNYCTRVPVECGVIYDLIDRSLSLHHHIHFTITPLLLPWIKQHHLYRGVDAHAPHTEGITTYFQQMRNLSLPSRLSLHL